MSSTSSPVDIDFDLWISTAVEVARREGLRPNNEIRIFEHQSDFDAATNSTDRRWASGELRGLCSRGEPRQRLIYVAPADEQSHFETLAHELAHAVTPWRDRHSETWLQVTLGILAELVDADFANSVEARYRDAYSL